jgi:chromosome segregation ATPase
VSDVPFVSKTRLAALVAAERDLIAHHDAAVSCDEATTAAAKVAAELRTQVRGLSAQLRHAEQVAETERAFAQRALRERDDAQKLADTATAQVVAATKHIEDLTRQLDEAVTARAPQPAAMEPTPADERIARLEREVKAADRDRDEYAAETRRLLTERDEARHEVARLAGELETAVGLVETLRREAPGWPINNESTRGCEK